MAIVKMKKLRLLVSRTDRESVLRELMLLGCVEVSEPDEMLEDPDLAALTARENADLDRYREERAILTRGLDVIRQYVPIKTGLFAMKPEVTDELLLDESDSQTCLNLSKTLDALDNRIRRLMTDENNENNLIESSLHGAA